MYYPFLRGKQFDLLALQALLKDELLSEAIVPIIEPVRDSATLKKTIQLFDQKKRGLYIIENPLVGTYRLFADRKYTWQLKHTSVKRAWFLLAESEPDESAAIGTEDLLIIDRNASARRLEALLQLRERPNLFLIPDEGRYRQAAARRIVLRSAFQPRSRVEEYGEKADDFFTDDHLFYKKEGALGFSDYTIEGRRYFDKGGPSRAIALHITYFDAYQNLRVKHFVSDSNEDAKEQGQKFFEALAKLSSWYARNQDQLLLTTGLAALLAYRQANKFPGLGTIKKWSLAHHLELVGSYLDYGDHWLERGRLRHGI